MIKDKKEQVIIDMFDFNNVLNKFKTGEVFFSEKDFSSVRNLLTKLKTNSFGKDFTDAYTFTVTSKNNQEQFRLNLKVFYKEQCFSHIETNYDLYTNNNNNSFSLNTNKDGKISYFAGNWFGEHLFSKFKFKCFKNSKSLESIDFKAGIRVERMPYDLFILKKDKKNTEQKNISFLDTDLTIETFFNNNNTNEDLFDLLKLKSDIDLSNMTKNDICVLEVIYNISKTSNKSQSKLTNK